MIDTIKQMDCTGCKMCKDVCPKDAISYWTDREGFWYPVVDKNKCISCGLCVKTCPVYGKPAFDFFEEPKTFAAWNNDEKIRYNSSSGGIFKAISQIAFDNKGIVYGAAYDENFMVHHVRIDSEEHFKDITGSKYVHSFISPEIYKNLIDDLKQDNMVVFSGTPCQVAAIYKYTNGKMYKNLITVEVLCHGVPLPKAWKNYLKEVCVDKPKLVSVNMRDKTYGWTKNLIKLTFSDGTTYNESYREGIYGPSFFKNLILRESCYVCHFTNKQRQADITLGDFWGCARKENMRQYDDDDKGTSALLINSEKGLKILSKLENCSIFPIPYEYLETTCYLLRHPSKRHPNREVAFEELGKIPYSQLVKKFIKL